VLRLYEHLNPLDNSTSHQVTVLFCEVQFCCYFTFLLWIFTTWLPRQLQKYKKVKLCLCLTNQALRHEGIWWSGCIDPHFLDLGTSWRWVASFTPGTQWIRGRVDLWAGLNDVETRKPSPLPGLKLYLLVMQPVACRYTGCTTLAHREAQHGIILWPILNHELQEISQMMQLQIVLLLSSDRPISYELKKDLVNVQQWTCDWGHKAGALEHHGWVQPLVAGKKLLK
jgi:hypothetical protein